MDPSFEPREYEPIQPRGTNWRGLARRVWAPGAPTLGGLVEFRFLFFQFASVFITRGGYAPVRGWRCVGRVFGLATAAGARLRGLPDQPLQHASDRLPRRRRDLAVDRLSAPRRRTRPRLPRRRALRRHRTRARPRHVGGARAPEPAVTE